MSLPTELVFLDIETTALAGPDAGTDAIIEIAAARVNLKTREIVDEWSTLVRPFSKLERFPYQHEQTVLDVFSERRSWRLGEFHRDRYAPIDWHNFGLNLAQALDALGRLFLRDGATVAGNNPGFDLRHIRRDWEAFGSALLAPPGGFFPSWPKLDYHVIDLVSPSFLLAMTGEVPGCSLRHTAPLAGMGEQKHRALDDVRASIAVFWLLADMMAAGAEQLGVKSREPR